MTHLGLSTENKIEELLSAVDINVVIRHLRVHTQDTLDKLKAFSEREGRRKISELNELMDSTDLNEFLRLVFNDDHPTLNSIEGIRGIDYMIETCKSNGEKLIKASKEKGLSFCNTITKFVEVAKLISRKFKYQPEVNLHVYKINQNAQLPNGLAFNKDSDGHVSLIATENMSWNDMISKLQRVSEILEHFTTIRIGL